jgi:hypothetical protein
MTDRYLSSDTPPDDDERIWPPVLDRRPSNEVGQDRYPASPLLAGVPELPPTTRHVVFTPADQNTFRCRICGQYGACTAYGSCSFLAARSYMLRRLLTNHDRHAMYHEFQQWDIWRGDFRNYEGSSANGAGLAMRDRGYIDEFRWAHTPTEVAQAIYATKGGVLLATDWHNDMFTPDGAGYVHVAGGVAGGHMYHVPGWELATRSFELLNSWGTAWGVRINGYRLPTGVKAMARISWADMGTLLADGGECLVIPRVLLP